MKNKPSEKQEKRFSALLCWIATFSKITKIESVGISDMGKWPCQKSEDGFLNIHAEGKQSWTIALCNQHES